MCKAKHYTEQLLSIYNSINSDIEQNYTRLTKLEGIEQDLLHILEAGKFNARQGYMLAKKIKEVRIERRKVKIEWQVLNNLKKSFCDKNCDLLKLVDSKIKQQDDLLVKLSENKVYKPRVLENIDLKFVVGR